MSWGAWGLLRREGGKSVSWSILSVSYRFFVPLEQYSPWAGQMKKQKTKAGW